MNNLRKITVIFVLVCINTLNATQLKSVKNDFLNQDEMKYLEQNRVIKMCNNPNWAPIEFTPDGKFENMQGIAIDTVKYLEKTLDVKFQNVQTKSWSQSQQFLKEKKCDLLPCAVETSVRKEYANFTEPYLNLPLAIFTTKDKKVVSGLDEIMDKPWTRQKGSGLITKLRKDFPNMTVIETKGDREALMFVNSGKAYFTIATLPVASHVISKFMLNNLHIAGYTGIVYDLSMAIRDDDLTLLSIIDKTLQNMSKEKEASIFRKWVSASVKEPIVDYSLLWKVLITVFIIGIFMIYRQYLLKRVNKELEIEIEKALEENTKQLQTLQQQSKMASMGEMIGAIAHQWRQPLNEVSIS
ncbi:MAG: transporter substrate-binding domain-containing protein, partial [Campylobacterota bacterium]|nr:transporter substrate-binding domain-containing protein [Campylobacterota bacterium]